MAGALCQWFLCSYYHCHCYASVPLSTPVGASQFNQVSKYAPFHLSLCALEDDVTHHMDMKGSAASDRETEGGKSISPRVLAPVPRSLLQGQRPRPCHWAVQSQLPGEPSSPSSPGPPQRASRSKMQAPLSLRGQLFWTPARSSLRPGLAPCPSQDRRPPACLCLPSAACFNLTDSPGSAPVWTLTPPASPQGAHLHTGSSGSLHFTPFHSLLSSTLCNVDTGVPQGMGLISPLEVTEELVEPACPLLAGPGPPLEVRTHIFLPFPIRRGNLGLMGCGGLATWEWL